MMRRSRLCLCCIVLATSPACANEQRFDAADPFIRAAMKHWDVPGLAIVVVKDGQVAWAKGYGIREIGSGELVDQATLFDVASCTKSFTAASVAVLVDQGKLHWDDPVTKHLPHVRFPDEYLTRHATLRDLLCHRMGLQRGDLLFARGDLGHEELLRRIELLEIEAAFRTKHTYSNLMYDVLGEVVARSSERSWPQFVRESLLEPLDMHATTFSIGELQRRNFAPRHWRDEGTITSRGRPVAGGIYSSADDLAKWLQFQLALGRSGGRQLISEQAMREMRALHHSIPIHRTPKNNPYAARFHGAGLGWFTLDYRGRKLVLHTGAWGAVVALVPEEKLGVAVLSNLDWNGMAGMLTYRVLDSYCAPSKTVWTSDNFKQFDSEGPGYAYRNRDRERVVRNASRAQATKPALPLENYAGRYRSALYGDLQVLSRDERLSLQIGRCTTELTHWESDVFYAKAPTQLNYDWLVQFAVKDGSVNELTLKYVGWHEPDATFQRISERK